VGDELASNKGWQEAIWFWCKKLNDLKIFFQTWPYWYYYLKKKRCVIRMEKENIFKWKHYQADMILWTVRWYLRYNLSFRDLVEMMEERGLSLSHTTIMRWVHQYNPN
jgi:IS6 family transposase